MILFANNREVLFGLKNAELNNGGKIWQGQIYQMPTAKEFFVWPKSVFVANEKSSHVELIL